MLDCLKSNFDVNIEFMRKLGCQYVLTTKNRYNTKQPICREKLSTLFRYLNRDIYKGRYIKELNYLKGFAIEEFKILENTWHYHILIKYCPYLPEYDEFDELIKRKVEAIKRQDQNNYVDDPFLQNYYNYGEDNLEHYVSKDFIDGYLIGDDNGATVGLLGPGDVVF